MSGVDLPEYRGPLTPAAAAAGINAAIKNAARLAADARLLLDAGRHPTAASLAALSIEETGKVSVLRALALKVGAQQLRDEWRRYRDHRSKNGMWILPALAANGARYLHDLASTIDREAEHTALLNKVKQLGFYTDCYGSGSWSEPGEVVGRELAEQLVGTAELLASGRAVSVREMELWVEIVGPTESPQEMSIALVQWAALMHQEGLTTTTPEEFEKFVRGSEGAAH